MKGFILQAILIIGFFLGNLFNKTNLLQAQAPSNLVLDSCYLWAEQNYPLVRQYQLLDLTKEFSLKNASKGYYPQLTMSGLATYQSAVTALPGGNSMSNFPTLSKDQYKLYGEIVQPITDLFTLKYQKEQIRSELDIEVNTVKVDEYALRDRINQLYFGILMVDVQLKQTELLKLDISNSIVLAKSALRNGVGLQSNIDLLQAELLKNEQKKIELKSGLKSYKQMLSYFINKPITDSTKLEMPVEVETNQKLKRPELNLFDAQRRNLQVSERLLNVKSIPNFYLFAQGGYARPGLNFLDNNFTFYYIGGIKLSWDIASLYTLRGEKKLLRFQRQIIDIQQDVFLFSNQLNQLSSNSEIQKAKDLIVTDAEIVELRKHVAANALSQLKFGVITANDFISELYAKDQAEQNLYLHKIQLLMAEYALKIITGN